MHSHDRVKTSLQARKAGHTLPGEFYKEADFFAFDLEAIFYRQWIFAGLETELDKPGDYITLDVGPSSVLVLRNRRGEIKAFFNTCRHRGAKICLKERGRASNLVCPYHQWSYDLDGELVRARLMADPFNRSTHGLKPVHVALLEGTIFICLADAPPDFSYFGESVGPLLRPHDLANAKVAHEATLHENGNWKLVMENSRECYHCAAQHPGLMHSLVDFYDLESDDIKGHWRTWEGFGLQSGPMIGHGFRASRIPLANDAVSITRDGGRAASKTLGSVGNGDIGSLRWTRFPNMFSHITGDYAFFFRLLPLGPQQTVVNAKWLVHKDAVEGVDYDLRRLTEVWSKTNDEDRWLVENNQLGVNSQGYEPGPYSLKAEFGVAEFVDWYCAEAMRHLDGGTGLAIAAE